AGTATKDQVLTASNTLADADGLTLIAYQWQRNTGSGFADIAGATAITYTLGDADVGASIRVVASYTDGHGTLENVASAATTTVTNNVLTLSVAQYLALGTVTLPAAYIVTLADTGANLAALSAAQFGGLAGKGIDSIDATDNVLSLNLARYNALGAVLLTATDNVTLADTGANL
ncbi:hypothetical protein, partial [Reyranella soli]|uniref:hypothetical protein n=1 Tax=Reyranella soli TaxID=1230389 RepID=UPI0014786D0D